MSTVTALRIAFRIGGVTHEAIIPAVIEDGGVLVPLCQDFARTFIDRMADEAKASITITGVLADDGGIEP